MIKTRSSVKPDKDLRCLGCGCRTFKVVWDGVLDYAVIMCKKCGNRELIEKSAIRCPEKE
jgi:transcription elongation factor Elf1